MYLHETSPTLAKFKIDTYKAEALNHRLANAAKSDRTGGIERLMVAIARSLATFGETLKRAENRHSIPAV